MSIAGNAKLLCRIGTIVLALCAPPGVQGSVDAVDDAPDLPVVASPATADKKRLQLRCWQDGRLLFEEYLAALPKQGAATRISGFDRSGQPIHVAEVGTATCLIRRAPDDRAR